MSAPATSARIITCAVTGSVHTPSMSPHLPVTAEEIAEQAVDAARAGAAVLHLHVRDPETGKPSASADLFEHVVGHIRANCDAVINCTTGGSVIMTLDERLEGPKRVNPEICSLNLGTMNFGLFKMARKAREWRHDWEVPYLEATKASFFKNTFVDIERILTEMGEQRGAKFEFECYDIGHLYTLAHFVEEGLAKPPLFIQSVFGILGGIGTDLENVEHMKRIADKLFGSDYQWSVLGAGRSQMPIATHAVSLGGNLRVGLEDSLWMGPGRLAESNADQVRKAVEILSAQDLRPATPDEARRMLGIPPR